MNMPPARKVVLIFLLVLLSLLIILPKELPININVGPVNINNTFTRRDLDINFGGFSLKRNFDLVLGLDLAGGSRMVFDIKTEGLELESRLNALESLKSTIERRVNLFGVSEPNVQISSFEGRDRIIVELPGVSDTEDAIDLIGQIAELSFAEVPEGDSTLEDGAPPYIETDLTGADLKVARIAYDSTTGKPIVSIEFTDEGAKKFEILTENNVGKPLPILLDGLLLTAPIVNQKITGNTAQISGDFTQDYAKTLSIQLNAGALPVPIELFEQKTIGPSLGIDSIQKSIRAGLVGIVMVAIFMIIMYGKLGLVADIALIIFGILTLAVYKLIPVVLTLPGIAGFLLSMGMAVDSNILIFERFKEEREKRSFSDALEISFGRAWDSIRDANIATLVTAFVLANPLDLSFLHTSGPVRGFAITLTVGIVISMFTGIVVSRNLLRVFIKENKK